jgi:hypothetical protein
MSLQNLIRLSQIENFSLPDYVHVNKVSKKWEKMTINVIQHDDRLWYLRPFYNGAFSVVSKHDFDDQFFFARDSIKTKRLLTSQQHKYFEEFLFKKKDIGCVRLYLTFPSHFQPLWNNYINWGIFEFPFEIAIIRSRNGLFA